jgi:serine/threonine protein kinase
MNACEWEELRKLKFHPNIAQYLSRLRCRPPIKVIERYLPTAFDLLTQRNPKTQQLIANECHVLIMEYFPKGNLDKYHKNNAATLTTDELLEICQDVAESINYLYASRIVHRDVKMDNFVVSESGVVALCDFGLAIRLSEDMTITRSPDSCVGGNQNHLAP